MLATVFFSGTYVATLFFWDFGATVFFLSGTLFFSGTSDYAGNRVFFWDLCGYSFFLGLWGYRFFFWDILFFSGTLRWATLATVFFSGTFGTVGSSGTGVTEGSVVEGIIAPVEFEV